MGGYWLKLLVRLPVRRTSTRGVVDVPETAVGQRSPKPQKLGGGLVRFSLDYIGDIGLTLRYKKMYLEKRVDIGVIYG